LIRPGLAVAVLLAAAPRASAQSEAPPAGSLLDRVDGTSRAGIEAGYSVFDDGELGMVDFTAVRFDLHGQWVAPAGWGAYGIIPLSYGSIDSDIGDFGDSEWQVGNVELGGIYRLSVAPELDLVAHLGVTLPLVGEGTFSATEIDGFATALAIYARPNDLVHTAPEATYLRLRADVAIDVPVHSGTDDDLPTIGRLNGAAGVNTGQVAFMAELVNLILLEEPESEETDRLLTFLGVTARYVGGQVQPSLSLLVPLDDEVNDAVKMALLAGVQVLLP
jgi:hypothetical protein